jgi:hypothetical protein
MTLVKPYLFLNRLVIISHNGEIAYDEKFHHGVNIVRGRNSSGKSTIANFLFYALGGDFNNWTTEAMRCREIFAEVEINNATFTLKRFVKDAKIQSMSIFWGSYEVAIKSNFEGWKHFPYSQTDNLESFSSILFNALEFPQVRSDSDSKITMHQILRLMYIDQDSPTSNLFRFERFDQHLTRQAISELLLGVYDDSLYQDRLNLRDAEKSYKQKKEQFDGVIKVFGDVGSETDVSKVQKEIEKTKNELNKVQEDIIKMREKAQVTLSDKTPLRIEKLQTEIGNVKNQLIKLNNEVKSYELDIADSKQFIGVLGKRLVSLNNSIQTKNILGDLPLEYCPQCLRPIKNHVEENSCVLCRQPFEDDLEKTYAKRLKQEIELQIKESNKLLNEKNKRFATLVSEWNPINFLMKKINASQLWLANGIH